MTLTEFLLARIAEDEESQRSESGWGRCDAPESYHWGPARVLAECEAKRRIVELHYPLDGGNPEAYPFTSKYTGKLLYAECAECGHGSSPDCPTLRLLALPYADHPDYREEWKP